LTLRYVPVSKIKIANAGANVVCKVANRENKLKAVSDTVWVCMKAMSTEKTIKEECNCKK
jgi:hypothetical protein